MAAFVTDIKLTKACQQGTGFFLLCGHGPNVWVMPLCSGLIKSSCGDEPYLVTMGILVGTAAFRLAIVCWLVA